MEKPVPEPEEPSAVSESVSVGQVTKAPPEFSAVLSELPNLSAVTLESPHAGQVAAHGAGQAHYILEAEIGKGGMGVVHRAVQTALGRYVAVKRIRREPGDDSLLGLYEFHQEAVIAARLEHPNIVPVHDYGVDADGSPMLSMKLVEGTSWKAAIDSDWTALAPEDFLAKHTAILSQVVQAVAFAHSRGVIHRDLKPAQVMLGTYGEVLLMDWGLAIATGAAMQEGRNALPPSPIELPDPESASSPAGTPAFMAPEQTTNEPGNLGTWTDVYLLGGILYYILTRTPPHAASRASDAMARACTGVIDSPELRAPGRPMPAELVELATHALRAEPAERVASAEEFLARLGAHLSGVTRRREAAGIVEKLRGETSAGLSDYDACGDALARLRRAESLWPEVPGRAEVADTVHSAWAGIALAEDDLQLARIEARQVRGDGGGALLARIETRAEQRRSERSQRRFAIAGSFVLLLALLVGSALFAREVSAERDIAERERRTASTRAQATQKLSEFMLGDLGDSLDPESERDQKLIAQITDQVMKHYRELDVSKDDPKVRLAHAAGASRVARELIALGRSGEALELIGDALKTQRADAPGDQVSLCSYLGLQAECLAQTGKDKEALQVVDSAIAEWKASGTAPGLEYAEALNNRAAILISFRRLPEGLADVQQAVEIRNRLLGPDHEETLIAKLNLSAVLMFCGKSGEAEQTLAPVLETAGRLHRDRPIYLHIMRLQAVLLSLAEKHEECLALTKDLCREHIRRFGPTHPATMNVRRDYASTLSNLERTDLALAELDSLVADLERAGETAAEILPDVLGDRSDLLMRLKRPAEAKRDIERALAIYAARGESDTSDVVQSLLSLGTVRVTGDAAESATRMESIDRAIGILEKVGAKGDQDYGRALHRKATLLWELGRPDPDLSVAAYEATVRAFGPTHSDATNQGLIAVDELLDAGRRDDARKLLERIEGTIGETQLGEASEQLRQQVRRKLAE